MAESHHQSARKNQRNNKEGEIIEFCQHQQSQYLVSIFLFF